MLKTTKEGSPVRTIAVCGERIKEYRKLLGWTQEELAKQSGYSDRLIRKAEGSHTLSIDTIQNLAQTLSCKGFKVCPDDLLSTPKKSSQLFLTFGLSKLDDIRLLNEIVTPDCELECKGNPRVPFTGNWKGVEGMFRWLALFHENVVDTKCVDDAVIVADDEHGFIHLTLSLKKKGSASELVDLVLRMRFRNSRICSVFVISDGRQMEKFFISRSM